jgi:hypothetical protein
MSSETMKANQQGASTQTGQRSETKQAEAKGTGQRERNEAEQPEARSTGQRAHTQTEQQERGEGEAERHEHGERERREAEPRGRGEAEARGRSEPERHERGEGERRERDEAERRGRGEAEPRGRGNGERRERGDERRTARARTPEPSEVFDASTATRVGLLRLARNWQQAGGTYQAIHAYTQVLIRYPGTGAASAAVEELLGLAEQCERQGRFYTALNIFNKLEQLL